MIAAAVGFGVVAISPFTIMPLLVGAMITDLDLSVKQAGYVAAAEMAGSGLAALVVSIFVAGLNRRFIAAAGLSLFVICNLAAAVAGSLETLLVARFVTGISSGMVVATISAIFAGTRVPERSFSFLFMGNLLFGMTAFLALPSLVLAHWGLSGTYVVLAILAAAVATILVTSLPNEPSLTEESKDSNRSILGTGAVFGLIGVLVYFIAIGALWSFVEQLGTARNLAQNHVGLVLSATQVAGIFGALLAAWLTTKFGRRRPILAGTLVSLAAMALYLTGSNLSAYALASVLFFFAFIFTAAYLVGVLSAHDRAGRLAALGVTMQTAGLAIGPAIAGETITRGGYPGLIWLASGCLIVSFALMMGATSKSNAPERQPAK